MRQNKLTPVIAHAAGWLFFFSLVLGFLYNSNEEQSLLTIIFSWPFLAFCIVYLLLFYFNTYLLIPKLYLEKKYLFYFLITIVLFVIVYFIRPFDSMMWQFRETNNRGTDMLLPPVMDNPPMDPGPPPPSDPGQPPGNHGSIGTDIISIVLFITVWSLGMAMCIIRQWRLTEQRALQAETEKANAELSFLKAQINPHFLFNTLNNIYSMVVTKNENAADGVMKLSNIMRYVTDEVREDYVPLESEVDCMRNYIDLQKMRLGSNMNVELQVKGDAGDKRIAPLLLMTFVENAFKHGVSSHEQAGILISLSIDQNECTFFCKNKLFDFKRNSERAGIGIPNARRRLEHLYPGKYTLGINSQNGFFTVQLTIQA